MNSESNKDEVIFYADDDEYIQVLVKEYREEKHFSQ